MGMLQSQAAVQIGHGNAGLAISGEPAAVESRTGDPRHRNLSPPRFGPPDQDPAAQNRTRPSQTEGYRSAPFLENNRPSSRVQKYFQLGSVFNNLAPNLLQNRTRSPALAVLQVRP